MDYTSKLRQSAQYEQRSGHCLILVTQRSRGCCNISSSMPCCSTLCDRRTRLWRWMDILWRLGCHHSRMGKRPGRPQGYSRRPQGCCLDCLCTSDNMRISVRGRLQQLWWPGPDIARLRICRWNHQDLGGERTTSACLAANQYTTWWEPETFGYIRLQLPVIAPTKRCYFNAIPLHAGTHNRAGDTPISYVH